MERRSGVRELEFFCAAELDIEAVDAAEDDAARLRSSRGVRSVVRSAIESVRIRRGDGGRDGGRLTKAE
jgi:hypothetical protein